MCHGTSPRARRLRSLAALAALCLTLVAGVARAEGPGIKVGSALVFHPGISIGVGYDSNVFYATGAPLDPTVGAAYISVNPYIALSTLSLQRGGNAPHNVDFRFHLGLPLRFLASGDTDISKHYSIGIDGGFLLSLFPFGHWTFEVFDDFIRTSQPPYFFVKAAFSGSLGENINADQNQFGLRLRWRPGGQRFETMLQYVLALYWFESAAIQSKSLLTNSFQLRFKWNFFPKTALYLSYDQAINTYLNATLYNSPPSSYPLRAVVGLQGLITPKLILNVNIGYGNSLTQTNAAYPGTVDAMGNHKGNSYSNVVGLAELTWKPLPLTGLTIGYRHDFAQALIGTYYDLDTAYLNISQGIWKLVATARLAWERRGYAGNLDVDGLKFQDASGKVVGRTDHLIALHLQLDFPIKDWLILSIGDDLAKNLSDCQLIGVGPTCNYLRNDVWLRLNIAY